MNVRSRSCRLSLLLAALFVFGTTRAASALPASDAFCGSDAASIAEKQRANDATRAGAPVEATAEIVDEREVLGLVRLVGTVVDDLGVPVEEATIEVYAGTTEPMKLQTDTAGHFEIRRPGASRVGLRVERAGHHPHRDNVQLGEQDLELKLELRRIPQTTFSVRDRATGEPVTRFGLRIGYVRATSYYGISETELGDHPGGKLTVPAATAYQTVGCFSPGYEYFHAAVEHDAPGSGTQVLLLERGARIVGRAEGAVSVTLFGRGDEGWMAPWLKNDSPNFRFGELTPYTHQAVTIELTHGPDFAFVDLRGGVYHVLVTRPDKSVIQFACMQVESGATRDLGEVDLRAKGSLRGVVRGADGRPAAGVELELDRMAAVHVAEERDSRAESIVRTTDTEGRFDFGEVRIGSHSIGLAPGSAMSGFERPWFFDVSAGEAREVVCTVKPYEQLELRVQVTQARAPVVGLRVCETYEWTTPRPFGLTDSEGEVEYVRDSYSDARVLALSALDVPLGIMDPAPAIAAPAESQAALHLPLSIGSLELRFGGSIPGTVSGFTLRLERPDWPMHAIELPIAKLLRDPRCEFDPAARRLVIPEIAAGEWTLSASIEGADADIVRRAYLARTRVRVEESRRVVADLRIH